MRGLNRRTFLKHVGALAAALPFGARAAAPQPQRVAVVGAGLAGLVAAYELMQAGHTVSLFEARTVPGGRIRTRRDAFGDGLYLEEGAADFGDAYPLLRHYVGQFSLALGDESVSGTEPTAELYYVGGKRYLMPPGKEPDWPYALSPEERRLGMRGLWDKYARAGQALPVPFTARSLNRATRKLDAQTIDQLVRRQGGTDAAVLLLHRSFRGADFDHVSALQELFWGKFLAGQRRWSWLKDGNDRLPHAFAERLGPRVHYAAELRGIAQDRTRVQLAIASGGRVEQVEADHAVIAIPFSVLRRVSLDGSFSRQKRAAIAQLRYESATCVYLHAKTRFWRQAGLDGRARTDLPIGAVRDCSPGQQGTSGILGSEVTGGASVRLTAMPPAERLRLATEELTKVFPEMGQNLLDGTSVCWDTEPHALGAWAYYGPGEMSTMFPYVGTPEGRIHFAGEHTAPLYLMEGAAQSGARAAREINAP